MATCYKTLIATLLGLCLSPSTALPAPPLPSESTPEAWLAHHASHVDAWEGRYSLRAAAVGYRRNGDLEAALACLLEWQDRYGLSGDTESLTVELLTFEVLDEAGRDGAATAQLERLRDLQLESTPLPRDLVVAIGLARLAPLRTELDEMGASAAITPGQVTDLIDRLVTFEAEVDALLMEFVEPELRAELHFLRGFARSTGQRLLGPQYRQCLEEGVPLGWDARNRPIFESGLGPWVRDCNYASPCTQAWPPSALGLDLREVPEFLRGVEILEQARRTTPTHRAALDVLSRAGADIPFEKLGAVLLPKGISE